MDWWPSRSENRVPTLLAGTSLALAVVVAAEVGVRALGYANWYTATTVAFKGEFFVGVLTTLPFAAGVGYAGYWLAESDLDPERYGRIWRWTAVGAACSLLLNVAIMLFVPVPTVFLAVAWLRWAFAVGAGVGVLVGVAEARAIQNAADAERSAVRAEHLEVQRDLLDYLNSLLRHEVLNAGNVISGYASLLKEEHDEGTDTYEYSDTIHRKSEEITSVIEDVRVLLRATDGRAQFEPVDLPGVLREEAGKLTDLDSDVEVELSMPESVYVPGDALLRRVFWNLLANAVEHNDSSPPRVWVRVNATADRVTVEIADNGPGFRRARSRRCSSGPASAPRSTASACTSWRNSSSTTAAPWTSRKRTRAGPCSASNSRGESRPTSTWTPPTRRSASGASYPRQSSEAARPLVRGGERRQ